MFRKILLPVFLVLILTQVAQARGFKIGDRVVTDFHRSGVIYALYDYNQTADVRLDTAGPVNIEVKSLTHTSSCRDGFNIKDRVATKDHYVATITHCYADGSADLHYDVGILGNQPTKQFSKVITRINGFKVGDRVITGRVVGGVELMGTVTECFPDGKVHVTYDMEMRECVSTDHLKRVRN
jgi:hypothetical protein